MDRRPASVRPAGRRGFRDSQFLVRLDRQTDGMDDTLTPEASTVAEIQPFLTDPRWAAAPRQLRDAFTALTNGAHFTGCLQVEETPDDKLKWCVVAVVGGSIIHIVATGPRKPERFTAYHPLTVDVQTASVYPRSALESVSCSSADSLPQIKPEDPLVVIPNYVAHLVACR